MCRFTFRHAQWRGAPCWLLLCRGCIVAIANNPLALVTHVCELTQREGMLQ